MIVIVIIASLLLLVLWILLVPVIIYVDTLGQKYSLNLPGVIRAAVMPGEELFHIRGWIFFVPFRFNPFAPRKDKKRKRNRKEGQKRDRRRKRRKGFLAQMGEGSRLGRNLLRSIRVRRLRLNIDTDDFMLNASLVPVFSAVNRDQIQLQVNFEGHASLLLDVRTRLGGVLWAFARTKFQNTFNV